MGWINNIKSIFSTKKWFVETSWSDLEDWLFVDLFKEYSSRDLHKLSKTDYLNFYKGRCFVAVSTIAQAVAGLDRQVTDWKGKPINDPLLDLITDDFLLNVVSYMKLNGGAYIRKNKVWNKVVELFLLRPDLVKPVFNAEKTKIASYEYVIWPNKTRSFDPEEIISIQNFNPHFPYPLNVDWLSDVQAIATAIDADYQASKWNWKFFYNNASVDGVLETEQNLSPESVEKIQNKRDQKYRWTNNAHKIWILTGGLKYRPMNASQKEMDFVESRRFNRDEILWFFRVPKAMIGLWEWDNALNVRSFEQIFARQVIKPLAKRIMRKLNYELFGEWKRFEFVNIVPNDLEQTRQDRLANWMTLNEFRATRNLPPVADGDKLRSAYILGAYGAWSEAWNQEQEVVDLDKEIEKPIMKDLQLKNKIDWMIEKGVKEQIRWTEEYNQKYRAQKMERNNKFDQLYMDKIQKVFAKQQKEIISEYKTWYKENVQWKSILSRLDKKAEKKFPLLSIEKRALIYYQFLKDTQDELVKTEAEQWLIEVWLMQNFTISDSLEKQLMKNIEKFAWSIDTDTNKKLQNNFEQILSEWLSFDEWKDLLLSTFDELKTSRAELIVRTETVRAWNRGSELWRKESGVVEKKQRYTALDERVCEFCWPMNWKIVWLSENYFNKNDVLIGANGHELKLDYSATPYPPLHPNCRCVILPVIE